VSPRVKPSQYNRMSLLAGTRLLAQQYAHMSVNHYENFPVASLLLPARLRADVVNLYRFARAADDIADEGDMSPEQRREQLRQFRDALALIAQQPNLNTTGMPELDAIFVPLSGSIARHNLPLEPLTDLLSAFEQDTIKSTYANESDLMDYCRRSANPVGRLMLHLFEQTDKQSLVESDAICTALQRINFLQDVAIDLHKNRIYLPQEARRQAGVTPEDLHRGVTNDAWRSLMSKQIAICRDLMAQGKPLTRRLRGRIALEIRLIMAGGLRILDKIEAVDGDVFHRRPTLNKRDWIVLLAQAIRPI